MRTCAFVVGVVLLAGPMAAYAQPGTSPARDGLLGGRTFISSDVACADLPASASSPSALHVAAGQVPERRSVFAAGDELVINGGAPAGLAVNQQYFVRRLQRGRSSAGLLSEALASVRTSGWLTITAVDEHVGIARIDYACDPVLIGDYLEAYVAPTLPTRIEAGPARFGDSALVLSGSDRREVFGSGDILSVLFAPGKTMTPGAVVGFYRDRGVGPRSMSVTATTDSSLPPLVEIGEGVVVSVSDDHARVAVKTSRDAVRRGDFAFPR